MWINLPDQGLEVVPVKDHFKYIPNTDRYIMQKHLLVGEMER